MDEFGIKDLGFRIYPNPTSGKFQVSSFSEGVLTDKFQVEQIEIYNVMGEKVFSSVVSGQSLVATNNYQLSTNIDLSAQPSGIYFLHLKTEQDIATQKLIISAK